MTSSPAARAAARARSRRIARGGTRRAYPPGALGRTPRLDAARPRPRCGAELSRIEVAGHQQRLHPGGIARTGQMESLGHRAPQVDQPADLERSLHALGDERESQRLAVTDDRAGELAAGVGVAEL